MAQARRGVIREGKTRGPRRKAVGGLAFPPMDDITKNAIEELRRRTQSALLETIRPLAKKTAALLDECGSEDEFRLRCAAANEDPEDVFRPYGQYVALTRGMTELGIAMRFKLSDWWAFEKIPGAVKPDPWLTGLAYSLR